MLNRTDTATLRRSVEQSVRRLIRGPWRYAHFTDGDLAGLKTRLPEREAESIQHLGFCMVTDTGPVVVMCRRSEEPNAWCFDQYDRPGHRASPTAA